MALVVADRVKETTTTTGTGAYSLAGAEDSFQAFGDVLSNSDTTYYAITDGTYWEVGIGTYTSSTDTLARTTILESSNSDAAVNWTAGEKQIFVTMPADKVVFEDASGNIAVSGTVDGRDIADLADRSVVTVTVSGGKYYLDGTQQQTAFLSKSVTYRFDQSDSSNSGHPLRFSTTSDGTHNSGSALTEGVTIVGTPGSAGAYTEITLQQDQADTIYYYCSVHSGMGGEVYSGKDLTALTSTVDELNKLDGFTGVAADLNYAKDLRATGVTTTEFDKLDGLTATTTELNYASGVTSAIQTQIDSKLATAGGTMTGSIRLDQDDATASGGTLTLDLSAANNFKISITADTTLAFSNKSVGYGGNLIFVQDATGGHSFTLPSECKTPVNGASIVQSTGANEISILSYYVLSSTQILVNYIGDFA